ncbi:MAG: transposase [Pelosinus sp.]|nr:transposase [Pelosinus sp.]
MKKDNITDCLDKPCRKTIRLKEFDYSQTGFYFITICTNNRFHLFGEVCNKTSVIPQVVLNSAGKMIQNVLIGLPTYYNGINIEEFQIMPNHIHYIVSVTNCNMSKKKMGLPDIIHGFKTFTTKKYIDGVNQNKWKPFHQKLWQRNYYEHIIRNEEDYRNISEYISNNPIQWQKDDIILIRDGQAKREVMKSIIGILFLFLKISF